MGSLQVFVFGTVFWAVVMVLGVWIGVGVRLFRGDLWLNSLSSGWLSVPPLPS